MKNVTLLTVETLENAPRWKPGVQMDDADTMGSGQKVIRHAGRILDGLPRQEFEPAIDPAGNLINMVVRTNPVNPYDAKLIKKGADRGSYKRDVMAAKRKAGWIMVDRPTRMYLDDDGNERLPTLDEKRKYWPALVEEANKRRLAAAEIEEERAEKSQTDVQRILQSNAEVTQLFAKAVKKERGNRGALAGSTDE